MLGSIAVVLRNSRQVSVGEATVICPSMEYFRECAIGHSLRQGRSVSNSGGGSRTHDFELIGLASWPLLYAGVSGVSAYHFSHLHKGVLTN